VKKEIKMGDIIKVDAAELKSFNDNRFAPNVVFKSPGIKVVLAYFKPGQFIPVYTPGVNVVFYILEGEAEVVAGDERITAGKDDLIVVPEGLKRGVKALTKLTLLHVVQPPPSQEDHIEVHAKLAENRFE
jgi:mannose-6-phosphate isomerase-like protein (cupin superfamily)